ncbi:phosphoribosylformylglycinamidine synthase I [Salinarchaeum laminariae]|uniref:phosphoribosylformylglycinamidine synthase I n=1 Tax=Salinarchaeum laminariae TaxID=869888 RepID=UPI0020BFF87B|nr:phosphoribosylformylglycinamidine synthase I [Salinarchaeum laminariae]
MTVAVVRFGGSNCDRDALRSLQDLGIDAEIVWYEDGLPADTTGIVLPGGFSYGDYLRAGAMAARTPIMQDVREAADDGTPVLGICNGAQICAEMGLVDGAFTVNESARFQCEPVHLRVETTDSPFTSSFEVGDVIELPIAHGEGRYEVQSGVYDDLIEEDKVLFRYCDADGEVSDEANPNGSKDNVAGVLGDCDNGAVLMPHPERATLPELGGTDGRAILEGLSG